jgi:hypothetical protein
MRETAVKYRMNEESNATNVGPKIQKEKVTVERFIHIYCEKKHKPASNTLCSDCQSLLEYSHERLDRCHFKEDKPTCRKCPVHCYRPTMRDEIRRVMRFSGPRYAMRAPVDWIRHKIHDREDAETN